MALADNIVSYWKYDESSGNAADSVASNTLTNNGTAGYAAAVINNGVTLASASSQYMSIADASQSGLDFTSGDITFAGWINYTTVTNDTAIISKWRSPATANRGYFLAIRGGGTNITFGKSTDGSNTSPQFEGLNVSWTPSTATWYHVAMVYNATAKSVDFYVNGSQQGTTQTFTLAGIFNNTVPFMFGFEAGDFTTYLNAKLDEWGAWARALSGSEISQLYNGGAGLSYPFTSPGPTNLKSLDTNLKDNIKSYNTNVLANIKAINTNT